MNKEGKKTLNIVRNINKMTDPGDDGLRMPLPLASMKIKKPKKKKKWSKGCVDDSFFILFKRIISILFKLRIRSTKIKQ